MWIKICGITTLSDAEQVRRAGADAIGLVFAQSPRQVQLDQARLISDHSHDVMRVGVFVNETPERIHDIVRHCNLDRVQLHGDEPPEYCDSIDVPVIKAVRLRCLEDIDLVNRYREHAVVLLDAYSRDARGGTGKRIRPDLLDRVDHLEEMILAGGLLPETVSAVLHRYRPGGVDVSSGVESAPGQKDADKVRRFISEVHRVIDGESSDYMVHRPEIGTPS
jgi:phosphoribosylanthranilate isomerase